MLEKLPKSAAERCTFVKSDFQGALVGAPSPWQKEDNHRERRQAEASKRKFEFFKTLLHTIFFRDADAARGQHQGLRRLLSEYAQHLNASSALPPRSLIVETGSTRRVDPTPARCSSHSFASASTLSVEEASCAARHHLNSSRSGRIF